MNIADVRVLFQWVRAHVVISSVTGALVSLMGIYTSIRAWYYRRVARAITRELREWGPMRAGELSGRTGYAGSRVDAALESLEERNLVYVSNERWFLADRISLSRISNRF